MNDSHFGFALLLACVGVPVVRNRDAMAVQQQAFTAGVGSRVRRRHCSCQARTIQRVVLRAIIRSAFIRVVSIRSGSGSGSGSSSGSGTDV